MICTIYIDFTTPQGAVRELLKIIQCKKCNKRHEELVKDNYMDYTGNV